MTVDFKEEIAGEGTRNYEPDWEPLEKLVGYDEADDFKWYYEVKLVDGTIINVYRHVETRQWLHLATDGTAFYYTESGKYRRVAAARMVEIVCRRRPSPSEEPCFHVGNIDDKDDELRDIPF